MASSIRLTNSGAPETPPAGYARIYVQDHEGKLHLKMIRPDGTVEVFGTINTPNLVELGGTGISETPDNGQLLIGNGSGYALSTLTPGTNITITNTPGSIKLDVPNTSVGLIAPAEFEVSDSPVINTGTLTLTKKNQAPNTVYAGPSGAIENVPTFRLLTQSDIPQISKHKIIDFQEEVQDIIALTFEDSSSILLEYNDSANKLKAFLSETGVVAGTYGSLTSIPSINVDAQGRITSVTSIPANFSSEQVTDLKETIEDYVGALVKDTATINAEYNDVLSRLELHIIPESIITTNISASENVRAPTSQSIKQYVDDLIDSERDARIQTDTELSTTLNNFLNNAPEVLDTIVEIHNRFNEIELSIVAGAQAQTEALAQEAERVNSELSELEAEIDTEITTRIEEIDRVYNAISAHREEIALTPAMLTSSIPLAEVQQLSHIMPNSVVAFVDRIGMFEGLDFNLSEEQPNQVVLNLTSSILTIIDGSETIRISYLTKI